MKKAKYNIVCTSKKCRWFGAKHELIDESLCPVCKSDAKIATEKKTESLDRFMRIWGTP